MDKPLQHMRKEHLYLVRGVNIKYVKEKSPEEFPSQISDHKCKNKLIKICISAILLGQAGRSFPRNVACVLSTCLLKSLFILDTCSEVCGSHGCSFVVNGAHL